MNMIAKFKVTKVENFPESTHLTMMPVTDKPYDEHGKSEDNSFSRWTPSGSLEMSITNPAIMGTIKEGAKYYLNFTEVFE